MSEAQKYIGLTSAEVSENRDKYGINVFTAPEKVSGWKLFLEKFKDPLIIILLVAGALTVGISIFEYCCEDDSGISVFFEPVGVFLAIFLATGLGFLFERKADKEFALLNKVNDDTPVQVIRDGNISIIPRRDVVYADIVILNTGDEVPADGQLLESVQLNIDESSLTGEPICAKTTDPAHFDAQATYPSDMVLRGTKLMEGHGIMRVTAVGDATENGKVYQASSISDNVVTPLDEQLQRLSRFITRAAYIVAGAVIAGRTIMYFTQTEFEWLSFVTYLLHTLMLAVSLLVMSVPEGLPMAVTLSLAYSMRRMLKTNNLVRKLHACETMGATTVICTDKTGTLTQNKMQVAHVDFFDNPQESIIYGSMALNCTANLDFSDPGAPSVLGNPTEGALLLWLNERGVDYREIKSSAKVISEIPFSTERKFMATAISDLATGTPVIYVKGAPEIVFRMCASDAGVKREELDALLQDYQNRAMRTLGFAYKICTDGNVLTTNGKPDLSGLTFLGVAAISDPVRADVPDAVREVLDAGVKVKIVTGDTPATAREIGRRIGLWNDDSDGDANIITGTEFESLDDQELSRRVTDLKIIARARPMDKKRLVEALQAKGEVVAVTGDGTNDAPALKAAHVGLSMGDGTSVAKEASDITIIDNSFSSIGRAVMWGRSLYRNIQRFLLFQMTVNLTGCLVMLVGSFMGIQSPLTVTQMLWINLIMDTFAAVALASLPPSASVMKEKPRKRSSFIIDKSMRDTIIGTGLAFFAVLICLLYYFEHTHLSSLTDFGLTAIESANSGLSAYELSLFFSIFVMLQFWNMFNTRAFATGRSALHLAHCRGFLLIACIICIGQIVIVSLGGEFFSTVPLSVTDWLIIIGATSLALWTGEIIRLFQKI